jgi:hypothetical protein
MFVIVYSVDFRVRTLWLVRPDDVRNRAVIPPIHEGQGLRDLPIPIIEIEFIIPFFKGFDILTLVTILDVGFVSHVTLT